MSAKPLVFTGLISYSLYLWHLPVLAFAGYYQVRPLEPWHLALLLILVYALSAASWRYVESPVRGRRVLRGDSGFLATAAATTGAIALFGVTMWHTAGFPGRLSEADAKLLDYSGDHFRQSAIECTPRSVTAVAAGEFCRYGAADGAAADVVVWGDSHALVLMPAYDSIAKARNLRVHGAWFSACPPLLDAVADTGSPDDALNCGGFNRAMLRAIDAIDPELVILNAYWTSPKLDVVSATRGGPTHGLPPFQVALERTLHALEAQRRKVCVVGDAPTLKYGGPYAYAMARRRGIDTAFITLSRTEAQAQHSDLDRALLELRGRHSFTLVDPKEALCGEAECAILAPDGRSAYRDNNHLSDVGAYLISASLEACFDGVGDEPAAPVRHKEGGD
jgi:hypothetical protein